MLDAAWTAAQLYVRNRSAALCFEYAQDDIEGGSAVCVDVAGRLFIATAAHNFDRLARGVNWSVFAANRSSNHRLTILQANYRIGRPDDEPDVAWLEIDPQSARESDLVGVRLEDLLLYPTLYPSELYPVTGFPAGLRQVSAQDPQGHRDVTIPFGIYFTTVVDEAYAANSGGLIVLDYQRAGLDINGQVVEVEPHGMSGGGVWYSPRQEDLRRNVWDPGRLKLLGLSKAYFRQRHQITSEPIHIWLTVLRNDLPDLRDIIDPLLEN